MARLMGHRRSPATAARRRLIGTVACDVWTDEAVAHLEAIVEHVEAFNPPAARHLGKRLVEVADSPAEFAEREREAGRASAR
jgi:ParE-like toxin of type II ParDE toxin-antitoxin system